MSVLLLGLVAPDAVEGTVVDSDAALDGSEPGGLPSSHASHASFSIEFTDSAFDGESECCKVVARFLLGAGEGFWDEMPYSLQNEGSASAGVEPMDIVADFLCLRAGEDFLVCAGVLLEVEPREGRNTCLLLCFFAVRRV